MAELGAVIGVVGVVVFSMGVGCLWSAGVFWVGDVVIGGRCSWGAALLVVVGAAVSNGRWG